MSSSRELRVTAFPNVKKAMEYCLENVETKLRRTRPDHPVAIFDLDETVLKYYNTNEGTPRETERVRSFPNMKANIERLQTTGVEVVFLTARREKARRSTERTLRNLGLESFQLFMKPNDAPSKSSSVKKFERREKLVRRGATIVLNVGDQLSDHLHRDDWPYFFRHVVTSRTIPDTAPRFFKLVKDTLDAHRHGRQSVHASVLAEDVFPQVDGTLVFENAEWIRDGRCDVPTFFNVKMPSGFTTH